MECIQELLIEVADKVWSQSKADGDAFIASLTPDQKKLWIKYEEQLTQETITLQEETAKAILAKFGKNTG